MGTSVAPATGGAGAPGGSPGSSGADDGSRGDEEEGTAQPAKGNAISSAIEAFRAQRAADKASADADPNDAGDAGDDGGDIGVEELPAETPEEREERLSQLTPEEREAAEIAEAAAAIPGDLVVDLGPRRAGEESFKVVAETKADADHLRNLINRAADRDTVLRIREEADDLRAEADELKYVVQLDPSGFVLDQIRTPDDRVQLARTLFTDPTVFAAMKDWVEALVEHPEALDAERERQESRNIIRQSKVKEHVEMRRFVDRNERSLIRTTHKSLESLLPDHLLSDTGKYNAVFGAIMSQLQYIKQSERVHAIDPKRVPGLIQHHLSIYGVQPRSNGTKGSKEGAPPAKPPVGQKPPARQPTGVQLKAQSDARRRAAGAGPGAGSPAATMPKLPAAKPGTSASDRWKQSFAHIRAHLPSLRKAPNK